MHEPRATKGKQKQISFKDRAVLISFKIYSAIKSAFSQSIKPKAIPKPTDIKTDSFKIKQGVRPAAFSEAVSFDITVEKPEEDILHASI